MPNPNRTDILFIQDRSGSMGFVAEATISGFNEYLKTQQAAPGEANLTLLQFDHEAVYVHTRTPLAQVEPLTRYTYMPRGSTALYDAACNAIDLLGAQLAAMPEADRPGQVVVIIQTDGEENSSFFFKLNDLKSRIEHQQSTYNWQFLFFGAGIDAYAAAQSFSIPVQNAAQYLGDMKTTSAVYAAASNATLRARGGQSVAFTQAEVASLVDSDT